MSALSGRFFAAEPHQGSQSRYYQNKRRSYIKAIANKTRQKIVFRNFPGDTGKDPPANVGDVG